MSAAALAETVLVGLGVMACWLAAFGLLRLPDVFARLHCVGFAGAAGGFSFAAAIVIDRGDDPLGFKSVAAAVLLLLTGAFVVHATGRALRLRRRAGEHGR
ncbi:MAG: monovalent cation/H(+) antiporter subunit G [Stellaceae bacterium]